MRNIEKNGVENIDLDDFNPWEQYEEEFVPKKPKVKKMKKEKVFPDKKRR